MRSGLKVAELDMFVLLAPSCGKYSFLYIFGWWLDGEKRDLSCFEGVMYCIRVHVVEVKKSLKDSVVSLCSFHCTQ